MSLLFFQVYHNYFWPLEWTIPSRDNNKCYAKVICHIPDKVTTPSCIKYQVILRVVIIMEEQEGFLIIIDIYTH